MDIEKVAAAIEADAGEPLPDLRQALAEAAAGEGRVTTAEQLLVLSVRRNSGLAPEEFAERINTSPAAIQDWEQGRSTPPGAALCLIQLLDRHPELIQELAAA